MKESDDEINRDTVDAIKQAIELGYRHLDGAQCTSSCAVLSSYLLMANVFDKTTEPKPNLGLPSKSRASLGLTSSSPPKPFPQSMLRAPCASVSKGYEQNTWTCMLFSK